MTLFSPRSWVERLARGKSFWRHLPSEFGHETCEEIIAKFKEYNYQLSDYETGREIHHCDDSFANMLAMPK